MMTTLPRTKNQGLIELGYEDDADAITISHYSQDS